MGQQYKIRPQGLQGYDESDRPVGIVLIVLTLFFNLSMPLFLIIMGTLVRNSISIEMSPKEIEAFNFIKLFTLLMTAYSIFLSLINVVSGLGIIRSARWAFILALCFNGIMVIANVIHLRTFDLESTILSGAVSVYCAMRLSGHIGSKPI